MPKDRVRKQTCAFWDRDGSCIKGAICKFAHQDGGEIAPWPRGHGNVDTKERGISGPDVQALTMKRAQPDWASGLYLTGVQNLKDSFAVERFIVDAKALVWAIQNSVSYETIKQKLQSLNEREVADMLQAPPLGLSPLFAAVEARRLDVFRLLLHLGADSNEKIMPQRIPIMGFAILDAAKDENDMTDFVVALLARGANPQSIPRHMWTEYISTPCRGSRDLVQKGEDVDEAARWCHAQGYEELLAGQLHLTLRYFLNKAWELPRLGSRRLQVAKLHEITPLLETPYRIIGQEHAITMVIEKLISHVAGMKAMPLVMIYAGSSGHGKTELAKMMGKYLNAEHLLVDCTEMKHETDLLGPKAPYHGWQKGSPLSNHLSKTIGKRNIVFLDEFEKTTDEVRQALLLIWEDGEFRDRRSHNKMKCTDTIWILATNSGEHAIKDFYETELESRSKTEQAKAPWEQLDRTLQNQFANSFGNYVAGRIALVVPFVPFSEDEAAVVSHKFILELAQRVRCPVDLRNRVAIGNIKLVVIDDSKVGKFLSKKGYDFTFGARSLRNAVCDRIEGVLHRKYLDLEEEIVDGSDVPTVAKIKVAPSAEVGDEIAVILN